ncbi:type II toxin-antitoxin system Phd/YefM family antitoxin [Agrococcus lahaulensis]|uniref:type II toxin-antitoxin system Phd/YefM family antitoxin n=1 Tax=Agrococcus lahaulensis TaxID=341722 RepID=UPI000405E5A6|nr:type II toxin-antitoxin system prevent-host-death family antitoxin [Agrococcus lahaulensis]
MTTIGAYEAKTHLPRLLAEVERGATVTITRHGRPVARLVPISNAGSQSVEELVQEMRDARAGRSLGGGGVRDLIEEGRR